jgi:hypothetical protein
MNISGSSGEVSVNSTPIAKCTGWIGTLTRRLPERSQFGSFIKSYVSGKRSFNGTVTLFVLDDAPALLEDSFAQDSPNSLTFRLYVDNTRGKYIQCQAFISAVSHRLGTTRVNEVTYSISSTGTIISTL